MGQALPPPASEQRASGSPGLISPGQANLEPGALVLRRARRYQRVRRAVLACSVLGVLLAPAWHLARDSALGSGLAGEGPWAELARRLPLAGAEPLILGAPWTIALLGVEFLDPLAAAGLLAARSLGWKAALGVLPVLVLLVTLGRFFCGWLCPYLPILAVSNAARSLLTRLGYRPPDIRLPRPLGLGVLAALLIGTAISGSQLAPLVYPPSIIAREVFRVVFQGTLGVGALVVLGAFAFDTLVSRAGFCRSLCPGGALFSLLSWRSRVVVKREPARCTDCTACDVVCNLGQQPMTDQLDSGCERCGKCIAVCPTLALRFDVGRKRGKEGPP